MYRILTSIMGLGTYVPSLYLRDALRKKNQKCNLELIENYVTEETLKKLRKNQKSYHASMKVAKLGHKLAEKKLENIYDDYTCTQIIENWKVQEKDVFIVFSGNWMPVVKELQGFCKKIIGVHMDVDYPPSWKNSFLEADIEHYHIYGEKGMNYTFAHPWQASLNVASRWVYIHGGGWGMGNYQELYEKFKSEMPFRVMTTVHDTSEVSNYKDWKYYLLQTDIENLKKDNEYLYPKMSLLKHEKNESIENEGQVGLFNLYQEAIAIVSKPGGGTLLDSLLTARPLIFLEPIASHEASNERLWEKLGFGINFEDFRIGGFSSKMLFKMQEKLMDYKKSLPILDEVILQSIRGEVDV